MSRRWVNYAGLVVGLMGAPCLCTGAAGALVYQQRDLVNWTAQSATVIGHDTTRVVHSRGQPGRPRRQDVGYRPVIEYRYDVAGEPRTSTAWYWDGTGLAKEFGRPEQALRWAEETHPVGSDLSIYVDERDPAAAAVDLSAPPVAAILLTGLSVITLVVGLGVFFFA